MGDAVNQDLPTKPEVSLTTGQGKEQSRKLTWIWTLKYSQLMAVHSGGGWQAPAAEQTARCLRTNGPGCRWHNWFEQVNSSDNGSVVSKPAQVVGRSHVWQVFYLATIITNGLVFHISAEKSINDAGSRNYGVITAGGRYMNRADSPSSFHLLASVLCPNQTTNCDQWWCVRQHSCLQKSCSCQGIDALNFNDLLMYFTRSSRRGIALGSKITDLTPNDLTPKKGVYLIRCL